MALVEAVKNRSACFRESYRVDLPFDAVVYTAYGTMAPDNPAPYINSYVDWYSDVFSADCIVCGSPLERRFVLFGALTSERSQSFFVARRRNRWIDSIEVEQPGIKPGETPEEIVMMEGEDWRELLTCYADAVLKHQGLQPVSTGENLTGYCTWYYYYKDVTQQHLLENIEALQKNRSPYSAKYVQIDDGYQTMQGDWLERHANWPVPLDVTAARIINAGMVPGIWLMPFVASTSSNVYRRHPDWFVRDEAGQVVLQKGWTPPPDHLWACLDTSNAEVCEHLKSVFRAFYDMGYRYFKMDGLTFGLVDGVRQDAAATPVSAFRSGLKAIREAVPDCWLLACSSPVMPCIGLVDSIRLSNDTSRYFSSDRKRKNFPVNGCDILTAVHCTLSHFWIFDRWFRADPDVMMARQDNAFYTRGEAKFSILSGIMTGISITSDHLGTIDADRNALLAKAQHIRMRNIRPLDPEPGEWPEIFEGTVDGKYAVAIFNETFVEKSFEFKDLKLPVRCMDLLDEKIFVDRVSVPSHDAVLLAAYGGE